MYKLYSISTLKVKGITYCLKVIPVTQGTKKIEASSTQAMDPAKDNTALIQKASTTSFITSQNVQILENAISSTNVLADRQFAPQLPQVFDFNSYVKQWEEYAAAKEQEIFYLKSQLQSVASPSTSATPIAAATQGVPTTTFRAVNPISPLTVFAQDSWYDTDFFPLMEKALSGTDVDIAASVLALLKYDVVSISSKKIVVWNRQTLTWVVCKTKFLKAWIKNELRASYERVKQDLVANLRSQKYTEEKQFKLAEKTIKDVERTVNRFKSRSALILITAEASDDLLNENFLSLFDKTPDCIAVKGGYIVNLRTGEARLRVREDYWMSECDIIYDPNAVSEKFDKFISDITLGRVDLAEYLSFACGMGLCGEILFQLLFIFHGVGANGKGLLMAILKKILGSMQVAAHKEIFVDTKAAAEGAATPYLAQLEGKRVIQCNEPPANGVLNEALIKQLTGEDWVNARKLNQDAGEFMPIGKAYIICNDPLKVSNDPAMWRRPRMVPFECKFVDKTEGLTDDQRTADPSFKKSLVDDPVAMSAAFNWLLKGCRLAYQRFDAGLGPLECKWVTDATLSYRQDQDIYGTFISECLEVDDSMRPSEGMKQGAVIDLLGDGLPTEETLFLLVLTLQPSVYP